MYCNNCGNELMVGAKFCSKCGTPVNQEVNNEISQEYKQGVTENKSEEDEAVYTDEVTEDDNEEYGDVNNYIVLEETEIEDYINSTDY